MHFACPVFHCPSENLPSICNFSPGLFVTHFFSRKIMVKYLLSTFGWGKVKNYVAIYEQPISTDNKEKLQCHHQNEHHHQHHQHPMMLKYFHTADLAFNCFPSPLSKYWCWCFLFTDNDDKFTQLLHYFHDFFISKFH